MVTVSAGEGDSAQDTHTPGLWPTVPALRPPSQHLSSEEPQVQNCCFLAVGLGRQAPPPPRVLDAVAPSPPVLLPGIPSRPQRAKRPGPPLRRPPPGRGRGRAQAQGQAGARELVCPLHGSCGCTPAAYPSGPTAASQAPPHGKPVPRNPGLPDQFHSRSGAGPIPIRPPGPPASPRPASPTGWPAFLCSLP